MIERRTNAEIINALIGPINPVGETNTDNSRFENLKEMCAIVDNLLTDINDLAYNNRDAKEFSVKRSVDFAN